MLVKCEDCFNDFCRDHMNHKCDDISLENREHESDIDEFEDAL